MENVFKKKKNIYSQFKNVPIPTNSRMTQQLTLRTYSTFHFFHFQNQLTGKRLSQRRAQPVFSPIFNHTISTTKLHNIPILNYKPMLIIST